MNDPTAYDEAMELVAELRGQVEKLERENYEWLVAGEDLVSGKKILTTTEQIDAAWVLIEKYSSSGISIGAQAIREALNKLGIVRCEGCGGSGRVLATYALSVETGVKDHKCPDCNGHGWRIDNE